MKPILTLYSTLLLTPLAAFAANHPNVLLKLADDLGARDLGCFGSSYYETPQPALPQRQGLDL